MFEIVIQACSSEFELSDTTQLTQGILHITTKYVAKWYYYCFAPYSLDEYSWIIGTNEVDTYMIVLQISLVSLYAPDVTH